MVLITKSVIQHSQSGPAPSTFINFTNQGEYSDLVSLSSSSSTYTSGSFLSRLYDFHDIEIHVLLSAQPEAGLLHIAYRVPIQIWA